MKVNNLIYISDIANFYLFGISRNIQRKPTVNIGITPALLPTTTTLQPISGSPFASVTSPLMVRPVWTTIKLSSTESFA